MNDANNFLNISLYFTGSKSSIILDKLFSYKFCCKMEDYFKQFFDVKTYIHYPFKTGGFSGCLILGESHVNWHSFPESNLLKIQIYSCKDIENKIKEILDGLYVLLEPLSIVYDFSKEISTIYNKE